MRFYAKEFPEVGDTVMVTVTRIDDMGMRCTLNEYDDITGFARLVDMKRIRSTRTLNSITRVGRSEMVEVTDVDHERRAVDVSRTIVTAEEREAFEPQYHRAKRVHAALEYVAAEHKVPDLADRLGWPDFDRLVAMCVGIIGLVAELPTELREALIKEVQNKLVSDTDRVHTIVQTVDLRCIGSGGIRSIQRAIRAGLAVDPDVCIAVKRCPDYTVRLECRDVREGEARVAAVVAALKTAITAEKGGAFATLVGRRANADASETLRYGPSAEQLLSA